VLEKFCVNIVLPASHDVTKILNILQVTAYK